MHTWIDTEAALAAWLDARRPPATLGVDTEFMRTNTFSARLALVQLCIGADIALIDTVALRRTPALTARLSGPEPCVMHSAGEDLEALLPILPAGPGNLFDTQIAAAIAGVGHGLSYQKLVAQLFGVELAKAETRSDWMQRPLSATQLEYAAHDVAWLPQLHEALTKRVEELGRLDWLREDCRALVERVCRAVRDTQPQRALRGAADWPLERQALLRRVLLWRDATAREVDKPKPWILDDAHALDLSFRPPADSEELYERTRGLRALRSQQRKELLALLQTPLSAEELVITPIPKSLDLAQRRALGEMKNAVAAIAHRLGIAETLLTPRRHLESLLTDRAWPAALEGWRKPLLFDTLMKRMP